MENEFKDKVILVTGGTGTLGSFVTETFLEHGPKALVITYRSDTERENLQNSLNGNRKKGTQKEDTLIEFVKADVLVEEDVREFIGHIVQKHGKLDIMANIIGGYIGGMPIEETTVEQFDLMLNINLKSAFLLTKYAVKSMKLRNNGKIVHVSSAAGEKASGNDVAYSSSKAGLIRLVESVKEEVKDKGIKINCILPTIIDTKSNREAMPGSDFSKWLSPKDLSRVMLYLCSSNSAAINGSALRTFGNT